LFPSRGYLLKNAGQAELVRTIRTVACGGVIFSPGIAQKVMGYLTAPAPDVPRQVFDELPPRER
jgi:DNA-binding NarL/FixJ family response regulator